MVAGSKAAASTTDKVMMNVAKKLAPAQTLLFSGMIPQGSGALAFSFSLSQVEVVNAAAVAAGATAGAVPALITCSMVGGAAGGSGNPISTPNISSRFMPEEMPDLSPENVGKFYDDVAKKIEAVPDDEFLPLVQGWLDDLIKGVDKANDARQGRLLGENFSSFRRKTSVQLAKSTSTVEELVNSLKETSKKNSDPALVAKNQEALKQLGHQISTETSDPFAKHHGSSAYNARAQIIMGTNPELVKLVVNPSNYAAFKDRLVGRFLMERLMRMFEQGRLGNTISKN